ncbi:MAG TPA: hypothetical protein VFU38_11115 [Candidatus Krumholzibacteria bacterium]|nr:hypothetical protein [Candidatus Krumholzibacteria bacterium]
MARTIFHIVLGTLMWVVFGYYWYLVMQQPVTQHTKNALTIVAVIIAVITVFDAFWILHNIRLSKNGKRRTRMTAAPPPPEDFLGRSYVIPGDDLVRAARYVEVHVIEVEEDGRRMTEQKLLRVPELGPESR